MQKYASLMAQAIASANIGEPNAFQKQAKFDPEISPPSCSLDDLREIASALQDINTRLNGRNIEFVYASVGGGNWSMHGLASSVLNQPTRLRIVLNGDLDKCRNLKPHLLDGVLHSLIETGSMPARHPQGALVPIDVRGSCFGVVATLDPAYSLGHATIFSLICYVQLPSGVSDEEVTDTLYHELNLKQ